MTQQDRHAWAESLKLKHEVDFMRELPSIIGVPAESVFSQVVIGGFETDYVVDFGHRRLIIELDGAGHYLSGPDGGILQGRDAFQDIVFRRLGYEVIHIPFDSRDKWYRNRGAIPQLKDLAESLKQEALDPGTERRLYLEPLTSTEGRKG
jgi:very-short-patch-repair endonuclease